MLRTFLRILFVVLVAWPVVLVLIGINVRHRERLPRRGPAIIAANHNSHLDTLTLLTLFRLGTVSRVRPVAAADYFMSNPLLAWFSTNCVGILPIRRRQETPGAVPEDPLAGCREALARGEILLIFPEGTRGEPEVMAPLKSGVARLAESFPEVPVVPVYMHGLGRSMPRGSFIPVPVFCDVYIGRPLAWTGDHEAFMQQLQERLTRLRHKLVPPDFD
jgi:1-acyl-sn-glycerol-3-phosphate acyltransferase